MQKICINKLRIRNEIHLYLYDILGYAESAYNYITTTDPRLDKKEIIECLSSIPECIEEIQNLILKLEEEIVESFMLDY